MITSTFCNQTILFDSNIFVIIISYSSFSVTTTTLADGSIFKGNVNHQGAPHGYGDAVHTDGARYTGQWVNGCKHGRGMMMYPNGTLFEGKWRNDLKWGEGSLHAIDGTVINGTYINGRLLDDE